MKYSMDWPKERQSQESTWMEEINDKIIQDEMADLNLSFNDKKADLKLKTNVEEKIGQLDAKSMVV